MPGCPIRLVHVYLALVLVLVQGLQKSNGAKCNLRYGYMCLAGNYGKRLKDNFARPLDNRQYNDDLLQKDKIKAHKYKSKLDSELKESAFPKKGKYRFAEEEEAKTKPPTQPPSTTMAATTRLSEERIVSDWVRDLPKGLMNINNRFKLATLFRDAMSRRDVWRQLAKSMRKLPGYRRRSRKYRHETRQSRRIPYHPSARFRITRKG